MAERQARCAVISALFLLASACGNEALEPGGSGGIASAVGGTAVGGTTSGGATGIGGTPAGGAGGSVSVGGAAAGGDSGSTGGDGSAPVGGNDGLGGEPDNTGGATAFSLTSPAFENITGCAVKSPSVCDVFPDENVSYMDNANISPELHWANVPPGTQSFALVLFDATFGQAHWALWNIPADALMVAANVQQDTTTPAFPVGSQQANANFATTSEDGYFGPHIPCNVFAFELYALAVSTFSPMRPDSAVLVSIELSELREPDVLGVAKLTGRSGDYAMTCE